MCSTLKSRLENFTSCGKNTRSVADSGVARGAKRASVGTRPKAQALGAYQHTFCNHLKMHFKQKSRPKDALKCIFFLEKL